jgi:hypothetical protein
MRLAAEAFVDARTAAAWIDGRVFRGVLEARLELAAAKLGIVRGESSGGEVFEEERKSDAALRVKQDDAAAVDEFLAFLADNPGTTTELSLLLHWRKEKVMRAILHAGQRVSVVVERTGDRGQPRKMYVRSG